ncbi:MAG: hypothetical protein KDC66_13035 [Phaeodactylibacter sp.]|nr:hypothetical protein [Phaeodactylibacter sp.]
MLNFIVFLVGLALLAFGANQLVDGAAALAKRLEVPNIVIGLTIVAFGTSAPELSVNLVAAIQHDTDIAIGNVVGSNIFNVFFILGLTALISPLPIQPEAQFDILVNILASILLFVFLFVGKGRRIVRWEGVLFLALYGLYLCALAGGWF